MRNALWSIFITDSLGMPCHWYYDVNILKQDFGKITTYRDPTTIHPTSIMKLPIVQDPIEDVIGKKILHNKRSLYEKKNSHYHDGLKAGDITLNADLVLLSLDTITQNVKKEIGLPSYNGEQYLEQYVKFLTTPGTHNDSYADTHHRYFIINYLKGKPLKECCADENHDSAAISAMKHVIPALFAPLLDYFRLKKVKEDEKVSVPSEVIKQCLMTANEHLKYLFGGQAIQDHTESYTKTLLKVILGKQLREAIVEDGQQYFKDLDVPKFVEQIKEDSQAAKATTLACYTIRALPLCYYLAYKYHNNFDNAIIENVNIGGEGLSRGGAIGPLIAAQNENISMDSQWIKGLQKREVIKKSIEEYLNIFQV